MDNKQSLISKLEKLVSIITEQYYTFVKELDELETPVNLDLELYDELQFDVFDYWLDNVVAEKKLNTDFATFGQRGDGSRVAVWLLQDRTINDAPVVIIGSEGELHVIAPDYLSFLTVSALGYDMFQLTENKISEAPYHSKNDLLLNWLTSKFNIVVPQNMQEWLSKTINTNPNLSEHIQQLRTNLA